jgi:hypothetical protein
MPAATSSSPGPPQVVMGVIRKAAMVLVLGVCALCNLSGCTITYVERAETAYEEGRYLEVAEQLAKREADMPNTSATQRARYAVYRGLALLRLGDHSGAERWLSYAGDLERKEHALDDRQRTELDAGVAELTRLRKLTSGRAIQARP